MASANSLKDPAFTILVVGATGKQGSAVCASLVQRALPSRRVRIRAVVRDIAKPTCQPLLALAANNANIDIILTQANLNDTASLEQAFAPDADGYGVDAVFLNTTPTFQDPREEVRRASAVLKAAATVHSVKQVVYSSVVGLADPDMLVRIGELPDWANEVPAPADLPGREQIRFRSQLLQSGQNEIRPDASGRKLLKGYFGAKAQIESLTKAWARDAPSSRAWTILRPGWFMSNFLAPDSGNYWPELCSAFPTLRSALPVQARMMLVDPADIGEVAAVVLLDTFVGEMRLLNKTINVGSEAVGLENAATCLSAATGVRIVADQVDETRAAEEIRNGNIQRDVQAWNAPMQDCFDPAELEGIIGRRPTSFANFLARNKQALKDFCQQ